MKHRPRHERAAPPRVEGEVVLGLRARARRFRAAAERHPPRGVRTDREKRGRDARAVGARAGIRAVSSRKGSSRESRTPSTTRGCASSRASGDGRRLKSSGTCSSNAQGRRSRSTACETPTISAPSSGRQRSSALTRRSSGRRRRIRVCLLPPSELRRVARSIWRSRGRRFRRHPHPSSREEGARRRGGRARRPEHGRFLLRATDDPRPGQ